jgi:hypothetical protein
VAQPELAAILCAPVLGLNVPPVVDSGISLTTSAGRLMPGTSRFSGPARS